MSDSIKKTKEIIHALSTTPDLYKEMSKIEGEVWGRVFSDQRRNQALKEDQKAAAELKFNRNRIHLPTVLRTLGKQPIDGLSLACGGGRAERELMEKGICQTFHGIDIASDALDEARQEANKKDLSITYQFGDLNDVALKKDAYDLVVTQNCLHHVLKLEHLAEQIASSLRPGGVLWIHDYIGETQFQYDEERLNIVNKILDILPNRFHEDLVNQRRMSQLARPKPGKLISPFEAIRSGDIMPIFLDKFDILEKYESDSILGLVCPVGTRSNYLQNEESQAIFELLYYMDNLLIEKGIISPRAGMYLLTPKKE
jgi:2-polyprenyl-3-methyl-5-hydroxy-6-metoxy-1,4-benzoquinol methylase